jgi:hypothetical protein
MIFFPRFSPVYLLEKTFLGKDKVVLNYDRIFENIYIGNNQCCRTALIDLLVKEGI